MRAVMKRLGLMVVIIAVVGLLAVSQASADARQPGFPGACQKMRATAKDICQRSSKLASRHSHSQLAKNLARQCKAMNIKFVDRCSTEVCGYSLPDCANSDQACIAIVITKTFKSIEEMKQAGAKLLHRNACESL